MKKHIASIVTISRVFVAVIFYVILVHSNISRFLPLLVCFILIELSDMLDGFIARRTKTVSDLGKVLDPACDVSAHFLCLYALNQVLMVPPVVVVVFILREVWMLMLRMELIKKNVVLAANWAGKVKTWVFGMAIFFSLLLLPSSPFFEYKLQMNQYSDLLYYLAMSMSIFSGLQYLFGALRILMKKTD